MKRTILLIAFIILLGASIVFADSYEDRRNAMVDDQIVKRGVSDPDVIRVMRKVPRHLFVPKISQLLAYNDHPLRIGYNQTISQPYIVAFMTEAVQLKGDERVLEIGTGSGYQAAVLAELVQEVYTIEIVKGLADEADARLKKLGYENVFVKHGDGYKGWIEHAPYDAIVVTAAPDEVPNELIKQLKVGGRMVIPVGSFFQNLYLITKKEDRITKKNLLPVRFVPMVKEE